MSSTSGYTINSFRWRDSIRIRARPNGSVMKMESGPSEYRPRRRQWIEYETVSLFRGGIPVTTRRAGRPREGGMASSRSRNGAVRRLSFSIVRLTTTLVPGNARTEERCRCAFTLIWLQCTNSAARIGRIASPVATM